MKETTSTRRRMTLSEAAREGDRRDLLAAMRLRISLTMEDHNTSPRDLSALARRLMELAKEIESIDDGAEAAVLRFRARSVADRRPFDPSSI